MTPSSPSILVQADHHRRAAEVELESLHIGMVLELVEEHDFVNEASVAAPVVFIEWIREGDMEVEIRVYLG